MVWTTDIVGFTAMSSKMEPGELVKVLNDLFTRFDHLVERYGLNKVKTIGDCYMVTSIPSYQDPDSAVAAMCHFALDMIDALRDFNGENPVNNLDLRVGINTGPVVAGVVGTSRFLYDLWGDAARVQVTESVVSAVCKDEFEFESRGEVEVKGKGLVSTYFLESRLKPSSEYVMDGYVEDLAVVETRRGRRSLNDSVRRRSTLQGALRAVQTQMEAFNDSRLLGAQLERCQRLQCREYGIERE
ncbi:Receptor-type guanylate cyclase gcy [Seminavis robusta]|uniref:Receptor-type guanylate cyclase gcy n=1 Tax=Seminavis robusta TaxID=568900 RepID=A0A9N8DCF1_9STRA|nr:Receptor-type guanylate cyclase gcy [Seminavis robusta]|eukprot:Sro28_g018740.1 Receptor-type guanylate cyclase gcy (243) ;mRNA; r:92443-93389